MMLTEKFQNVLIAVGVLLLSQSGVRAQNMIVANPAEYSDFRSAFINPALLSFQKKHVAFGGKVYHLGFVEGQSSPFRQGYMSLALPFGINNFIGMGMQAQYFNSPLYSQSNMSISLAMRYKHIYSLGLKFNLFTKSYNQDNFDLVDPNDPLFRNGASKWAGTFGAGVSMFPLPFLTLGLGVDHINRANISLTNDSVYQPFAGYMGAMLQFGMARISLSVFYEDGRWLPKTSFGTSFFNRGYAMLGYSENALQAEGQMRVTGSFSLNYNYEYTIFDDAGVGNGSHSVTLIHEFNRPEKLPKFEMPNEFRADFVPPDMSLSADAQFYVYAAVDKMEIIEKRITRTIAPDVKPEQLAQITLKELDMQNTPETAKEIKMAAQNVDLGLIPATLDATFSKDYEEFLKDVSGEIKDKKIKTRIITPKESYLRAAGLRKQFNADSLDMGNVEFVEPLYKNHQDSLLANEKLGNRAIVPFETYETLSVNSTVIQITPVADVGIPKSWRLILKDKHDNEINTFSGTGLPQPEVTWNWRDKAGNIVKPGIYSFQLEWSDANDMNKMTSKKYLTVQKLIRNVKIEITNHHKETGVNADEIDIILKK